MHPIPPLILLVPLSIAIALWQWLRIPRPRAPLYRLLGVLILLALATEVGGILLLSLQRNNTAFYNAFATVEMLLVLAMVHTFRPDWTRLLVVVALGGLSMLGVDWAMHPGSGFLLTEGIVGVALLLSGCCLAVLWHLAQTSRSPLPSVPEFWLFMGLLVYFGGMPPMMAMLRYMYNGDQHMALRVYTLIPTLCVIRYLLTALACGLAARTVREHSGT